MSITIIGPEIKFSKEKPAIFEKLEEKFGVVWEDGLIIANGNTIHCASDLPMQKIEHEMVHIEQQKRHGLDAWWDLYLKDEVFRLNQEIEAYRQEVKYIVANTGDRNRRFRLVDQIAKDLSGSMYGNIITYREAFKAINS